MSGRGRRSRRGLASRRRLTHTSGFIGGSGERRRVGRSPRHWKCRAEQHKSAEADCTAMHSAGFSRLPLMSPALPVPGPPAHRAHPSAHEPTSDMGAPVAEARARVRALMPIEGDLGFRRRCETIVEFLDAQPGEVVLDCGCGYGFTLRVLRELTGARLVGLDLQRERVANVRERLGEGVGLVQGSALSLPFADETIDKAVSSEVLEHLPDDRAAVAELFRVLRPGGTLVVTVPSARYPLGWDPINYVLERTTGRHIGGERTFSGIWYGHRRLYDEAELRVLIEGAGFAVKEVRGLT